MAGEQSDTFLSFAQNWAVAMDAGLSAAGDVYAEAVRAKLAGGYTSGRYVGQDAKSVVDTVKVAKPANDRADNQRVVRVYSKSGLARLWEFGHHNRFTKRFERVEHWRTSIDDAGSAMTSAFHDVFQTVLGG